jgi:hypothetical protein
MPKGIVLFEFDLKLGPLLKLTVPAGIEVSQEETLVLFTTRTMVKENFSAITVMGRTWTTYFRPPLLFALILTPTEQASAYEEPMRRVLSSYDPSSGVSAEKLSSIYAQVMEQAKAGLAEHLLTLPKVGQLLLALTNSNHPLTPVWSEAFTFRYPEAEEVTGLSTPDANDLLASMLAAGLLRARAWGNVTVCPKCSSHQIMQHATCPKCGSQALESGSALQHFVCDYTGFMEAFTSSKGLVCPQCHTPLKEGTYRSLGKLFHCLNCSSYPKTPSHVFTCLSCKESFEPAQMRYLRVDSFTAAEEE